MFRILSVLNGDWRQLLLFSCCGSWAKRLPPMLAALLAASAISMAQEQSSSSDPSFSVIHQFISNETASSNAPVVSGSTCYGSTAWDASNGTGSIYRVNTDGSGYKVLLSGNSSSCAHPSVLSYKSASNLFLLL